MRRRQHRRRQVHGRGQHVARGQRVLHHVRVQPFRFAAREPVELVQPPVRRVDQRARAAGVVRYAELLHALRISPAPIVRYREVRQKRRRLRPRVERRQELAVRDQPLEHCPRKVVRLRHSKRHQPVRRTSHHLQRLGRQRRRIDGKQQVAGDLEYRPVVNAEYLPPLLQHARLRKNAAVRNLVEVLHAVLARQVLVKHQRVDQYRCGHPQRLVAVRLLQ